jgi:hypothetical protein
MPDGRWFTGIDSAVPMVFIVVLATGIELQRNADII